MLEIPPVTHFQPHQLLEATNQAVNDLNRLPAHTFHLSLASPSSESAALTVRLAPAASTNSSASLQTFKPILDIGYSQSSTLPMLAVYIANSLHQLFAEEEALLAHLLPSQQSLLPHDLNRRYARAMKYAPSYHLTFSLFSATAQPSAWDIDKALEKTLLPYMRALAPITNFTYDTQVQLFAGLSPSFQPIYDPNQASWLLYPEQLGGFVNAAEWPLSPSIQDAPTIHFLLYVPGPEYTPLHVIGAKSDSWIVPQWGGIVILDPATLAPKTLTADSLEAPLNIFTSNLLSLLGLPSTAIIDGQILQLPMALRISTLTRLLTTSRMHSTASTLGSLARLVLSLPSISIPASVADAISSTLHNLNEACTALTNARFSTAFEHARTAEQEAEKAFFHKSMVGQVYFPDEHKVAVYLPLLGPVAVPLIMSGVRELKAVMQLWKRPI